MSLTIHSSRWYEPRMVVKPLRYEKLKPFLAWWHAQFDSGVVSTSKKLASSLSVENLPWSEVEQWTSRAEYVTAFRRLRQDARLRVCRRFLEEQKAYR